MRNKKGEFTVKEVLELLLAVISILLILGFIWVIWNAFVNSEDKNAKKTADFIETKINSLKEGQGNTFLIQGFKDAGNWFIIGWSKGEQGRPDSCYFDSCICVCKGAGSSNKNNMAADCTSKGFCRKFSFANVKINGEGTTTVPTLTPGPMAGPITISTPKLVSTDYIKLPQNTLGLKIDKTTDSIILSKEN